MNPVLGTDVIPKSDYFPAVQTGAYSTGIFLATAKDAPATITGIYGAAFVTDPDTATSHELTLPHWPSGTLPASGSDGHADIYDETTGILHSFWQLKLVNGKWQAKMYAWSPMAGKGWGDPAHFYHGARATGVPAAAGLMRTSEVNDGQATYKHALAMSLTYNALSKTYIYPATSADWDASANYGKIPQGALLMLPSNYDTSKIANADLRKVAETLKTYGAYVVDRNTGTPFVIYVENGSGFELHRGGWNNAVAAELDRIRANLRQVVSASSWVDGDGKATVMTPSVSENKLSMRGPWTRSAGTGTATFDTWSQSLVFTPSAGRTFVANGNSSGLNKVNWGGVAVGTTQKFTVTATGGALLKIEVWKGSSRIVSSEYLGNGQSIRFVWPAGGWIVLTGASGVNNVVSSVRADMTTVAP